MSIQIFSKLPFELIDIIADFHDYKKYCFKSHQEKFRDVLDDIHSMSDIMPRIAPRLAYECWGKGAYRLEFLVNNWNEYMEDIEEDNYGMVGLYDDFDFNNDLQKIDLGNNNETSYN